MPTCGLTDYGPVMGTTRELYIFVLNPVFLGFVFHQLVPHWSPISCVLPFVGRLGPARAYVGLGFAVVGWFRRFCPSPPSAGLGPFPSASAFLFPCPFMVCPLWARCVGVCVLAFPLPFAFPFFVFQLSNSHLIFMFTSPSSFFIFTFTSSSDFTPCFAGCVCVCGTSALNFAPGLVIIHYTIAGGRRPVRDAAANEDRHGQVCKRTCTGCGGAPGRI